MQIKNKYIGFLFRANYFLVSTKKACLFFESIAWNRFLHFYVDSRQIQISRLSNKIPFVRSVIYITLN